ncbi:hypothetical protein [uncultured Jannaschia sp.]|uniref:hypothetical protein n=1 Tax=uncultured Jannaschia sp. TaxID=293347 RepID=UPI002611651B|nr:hypothetical protein [uncultured Jannaschia sp.]
MSTIDCVIIVAGASCAGKTTFLKKLQGPDRPKLPTDLQAIDLAGFSVMNAMDLMTSAATEACPRRIILHYDIFRPITFYDALSFDIDPVLDLVWTARSKMVLTLWEDPDILRERSVRRRRDLWKKVVRRSSLRHLRANVDEFVGARTRRNKMRPWFASRSRLWQLHESWFEFVSAAGVEENWVIRPSDGMSFSALGSGRPTTPLWPMTPGGTKAN